MSKANDTQKNEKMKKAIRTGLAASGFITAVLVVLAICFIFKLDMQSIAIGLAIVIGVGVGIPMVIFALRQNNDSKDEKETCQPILNKYARSHSTKGLIADYEAWMRGEHSSYTRVHFGGDVIGELQDAKEYEEALRLLDELGQIEMKARERYDYENYAAQARPQLLEGIEKEKKRAAERARNKNLR